MCKLALVTTIAASLVGAPVFAAEPALTAPQPAEAATPAKPAKPAKLAKDDPNRIVCTRESVVGSNRPEKVCLTVAERARMRDAASQPMQNDRGSGFTAAAGPGS